MHSYCAYFTRRYSEKRSYLCKKKVIRNIKDRPQKQRQSAPKRHQNLLPPPTHSELWILARTRATQANKHENTNLLDMQKDKQHRAGDLRLLNADRSLAVPTELKLYAQKQLVRNQGAKTGSWRASCPAARRPRHTLC